MGPWVDALFENLVATSWQVALLIVAVLVVQRLLRRWLTPRWSYALWCVVLFRLVVPIQPEVPAGAVDWGRAPWIGGAEPEPGPRLGGPAVRRSPVQPGSAADGEGEALALDPAPGSDEAAAPVPVAPSGPFVPARTGRTDGGNLLAGFEPAQEIPAPAEPQASGVPWTALALALWALGFALLVVRDALRERRFRRRSLRSTPVTDPGVLALFAECARLSGLRRPVDLVRCDLVGSPAVTGLRRPRLLLPSVVLERFDPAELRHVFLHELAHLKRGDVALNAVLVLVQRLYWFHPLVPLAFGRLRAAQESARDWEALGLARGTSPVPYARTLLRLLEERPRPARPRAPMVGFLQGGNAMKWRVLMITRFRPARPASALLGVSAVALLTWTAFTTSAGAHSSEPGRRSAPEQVDRDPAAIHGVAQSPLPDWWLELDAKLETRLSLDLREATLAQALEAVADRMEASFYLEQDFVQDHGYEDVPVALAFEHLTARQALNLLARRFSSSGWCLTDGVVWFGDVGERPLETELRFYRIDPILADGWEDERDAWDEVMILTQELTLAHDDWEVEGAMIQPWRGLLVVRHTPWMHAQVERALNLMRTRGKAPSPPVPAWKAELQRKLAQRVELNLSQEFSATAARDLGQAHGIPVVYPSDLEDDGDEVNLSLKDVSLAKAFEWIARSQNLVVSLEDGAVVFDHWKHGQPRFFEIGNLVHSDDDNVDWEAADGLIDLVLNHVAPDSWDLNPMFSIRYWKDMMVVFQDPSALDEIQDLLDAARRASDG